MSAQTWVADAEHQIGLVQNVRGVRIALGQDGDVSEVHVIANPGRDPRLIVRDIVGVFRVNFAREIDRRIVSVIVMPDPEEPTPPMPRLSLEPQPEIATIPRLRFESVNLMLRGTSVRVEVDLRMDKALIRGISSGSLRNGSLPRLVADATLRGVAQYVDSQVTLELEDVLVVHTAFGQAALVSVRVMEGRAPRELLGTALDRGDVHQATSIATLDAVNRVLGMLPSREATDYVVE